MITVDTIEPFISNVKYTIILFYSELAADLDVFKSATQRLSLYKDLERAKLGPVILIPDNLILVNVNAGLPNIPKNKIIVAVFGPSIKTKPNTHIDIVYSFQKAPIPDFKNDDKTYLQLKCTCQIVANTPAINLNEIHMRCILENYIFFLYESNQINKSQYETLKSKIPNNLKPNKPFTLTFGQIDINDPFNLGCLIIGKQHEDEVNQYCSNMISNQFVTFLKKHTTCKIQENNNIKINKKFKYTFNRSAY